jgi:ATP-binding cassette subfamily C (CFTR/MRP) protein 1
MRRASADVRAVFSLLGSPLQYFPLAVAKANDAWISLARLEAVLDDIGAGPALATSSEAGRGLRLEKASFAWGAGPQPTSDSFQLRDLDVSLAAGDMLVLLGPVASGKTSLLCAILGDLEAMSGVCKRSALRSARSGQAC